MKKPLACLDNAKLVTDAAKSQNGATVKIFWQFDNRVQLLCAHNNEHVRRMLPTPVAKLRQVQRDKVRTRTIEVES